MNANETFTKCYPIIPLEIPINKIHILRERECRRVDLGLEGGIINTKPKTKVFILLTYTSLRAMRLDKITKRRGPAVYTNFIPLGPIGWERINSA